MNVFTLGVVGIVGITAMVLGGLATGHDGILLQCGIAAVSGIASGGTVAKYFKTNYQRKGKRS